MLDVWALGEGEEGYKRNVCLWQLNWCYNLLSSSRKNSCNSSGPADGKKGRVGVGEFGGDFPFG